jgi:hypothetical protein
MATLDAPGQGPSESELYLGCESLARLHPRAASAAVVVTVFKTKSQQIALVGTTSTHGASDSASRVRA